MRWFRFPSSPCPRRSVSSPTPSTAMNLQSSKTVDMRARGYSNSFIPSNGVGTGFAREILEQLAQERSQIFDPASLTEDYEIGVYIHQAGYRQIFIPLRQGMR